MYAHIGRPAILQSPHVRLFVHEKKRRRMFLFPDSGTKKNFRGTVSLKTVTPHLCSIAPNVQRHMAYFATRHEYLII